MFQLRAVGLGEDFCNHSTISIMAISDGENLEIYTPFYKICGCRCWFQIYVFPPKVSLRKLVNHTHIYIYLFINIRIYYIYITYITMFVSHIF